MLKIIWVLLISLLFWQQTLSFTTQYVFNNCDLVIAGGTTESLAAALSAAQNKVNVCLIEPIYWVGGQFTSEGVPAIDFAWLGQGSLDMSTLVHMKENQPKNFYDRISSQSYSNTGLCWVSSNCFLPNVLLEYAFYPMLQEVSDYLQIFFNTVVKRVKLSSDNSTIIELEAIYRLPADTSECRHLSDEIIDWYSEQDSSYFKKIHYIFQNSKVFIDGSQYGDILSTSLAPFLQGIDEQFDGDTSGNGDDQCGQSTVFPFVEQAVVKSNEVPYPIPPINNYNFTTYTQAEIWTYRRLYANGTSESEFQIGDVSLQNWEPGNDYPYGYIFLTKQDNYNQVLQDNWQGGLNLTVVKNAEDFAYGWHQYFKNHSPNPEQVILQKGITQAMGTCHGLSALPYLRESRRSIGLDDFVIKISDLTGQYKLPNNITGTIFYDRVAIGNYNTDLHKLTSCTYPDYIKYFDSYLPLPFFLPFRAMTNKKIGNLIVTGRLMAQSFLSNSATRVHPVMWAAGTASGVCAAYMIQNNLSTTRDLLGQIGKVQTLIKQYQPIQWTINGTLYPPNDIEILQ